MAPVPKYQRIEFYKPEDISKITWSCDHCGISFGWFDLYFPSHEVIDHAPIIVELSDGKRYGVCSEECARMLAQIIAYKVLVELLIKRFENRP